MRNFGKMWATLSSRLIRRALFAALVAGQVAIGQAIGSGKAEVPSATASRSPGKAGCFDGWLTPDDAFNDAGAGSSGLPPRLPLLRIPAIPMVAPMSRSVAGPMSDEGAQPTALKNSEIAPESSLEATEEIRSVPSDAAESRNEAIRKSAFSGLEELGHAPPNAIENLPRLAITTVAVLAVCLGSLLVARRWLMKSGFVVESSRNSRLQIVATLTVAPRSQLHIIRMDGRDVLVGVDARGLQQIQIVPPSFDSVLNTSGLQDAATATVEKAGDIRTAPPPRRLFTAA